MPFHEVDALGFEAPAPVGHPGRANLPAGASTDPEIGERLPIEAALDPVDMPDLAFHGETGQHKAPLAGAPHMRRLVLRKIRESPLGALRSVLSQIRLAIAARLRARRDT